jgi:hypothetical protein
MLDENAGAVADAGKQPEIVPTPPNPLADRLRDFRDGVGEQPDEDKPRGGEGDEESSDEEQGEEQSDAGDEAEEEAADAGDEQDEEADDEAAEGDDDDAPDAGKSKAKAPLFDVEIPTLNADGSKGPRGTGVLLLEGLPQEFRDTITSHVKRSMQLDGALQRLEQARELETAARFYQRDPLNAMRLIAVEKPELAHKFVESWIRQNPKATKALYKTLKLDTADEEKLELQGQVAENQMRDELTNAYSRIDQTVVQTNFIDLAKETVGDIVAPLRMSDDDRADFEQLAGARIVAEQERRAGARQTPWMTKTELLTLLQPLVKRFTGSPAKPGKKSSAKGAAGSGLTREQMAERAKNAQRFRKARGGGADSGVRPSAVKKSKLPPSLPERIKLLRQGKL